MRFFCLIVFVLAMLPISARAEFWLQGNFDDIVDSIPPARMSFVQNGDTLRLPYLCNRDVEIEHPGVSHLVYMVHGTLRNADDYHQDCVTAAFLSGMSQESMLFTPQYLTAADLDSFLLDDSHLYWEYMGWRKGDPSDSTNTKPRPWRVSSFALADSILLRLADLLPDLESVVVAGHSAGGQFSNRYAAGSVALDTLRARGVFVKSLVSNPSTYLYFSPERLRPGSAFQFENPPSEEIDLCPDYDDYKYGLQNLNEYMNQHPDTLGARYARSEVVYLLGGNDSNPTDQYLDRSCPAMYQGQFRLQRGQIYLRYLGHVFGSEIYDRHGISIVAGVGHKHTQIFTSPCGLAHLFDIEGCSNFSPYTSWTDMSEWVLQSTYGYQLAWGDYDKDGDHDIYLSGVGAMNRLARNEGGCFFADLTEPPLDSFDAGNSAGWVDYDSDADLDLYLVNAIESNQLFSNEGPAGFVDVTEPPIDPTEECNDAAWGDFDGDGDLDVYLTRTSHKSNLLLENDGAGGFSNATDPVLGGSGHSRDPSWVDYDLDGDLDLYVTNSGYNRILRNEGGVDFTDVSIPPLDDLGNGLCGVWGDFDNDGDPDLFLGNGDDPDKLLRNEGDGFFVDVSAALPQPDLHTRSAAWADFDNDGWLDLYQSTMQASNRLLRNQGDGSFAITHFPLLNDPAHGFAAAWADADDDGDMDLYMGLYGNLNRLLRNELDNSNHWFQLDLLSGTQNRFGLGARIEVMAGGMLQSRQVGLGAGFMSQNSLTAEFGLGASTELDTLRIFWPSGTVQETLQVAADQRLTLTEPGIPTQADEVPSLKLALLAPYPNPFNPSTEIRFQLPQANSVKASIYDLNGRLVRRLLEDIFLSAGEHSFRWDGRDDGGRVLASGVYLLRFEAGGRKYGRKLVLLK